ncbi:MAG TPA: glycine cleavage system aminomethyltransferase GcvT [Chitinivibrionales bacterium]|nr:glycine cleavage system aminomethyltransferase GcvT [Chitinivibrionales bacterium]
MKKTFLYNAHLSLNAKIAPFGGYEMPIQYDGILAEHFATRNRATVFDTCHMGEFMITGANAAVDLERILSCPIASMKIGQCRYGFICNRNGGVIDDQIVYRLNEKEFFIVVNASTQDTDFEWIKSNISPNTSIENLSPKTGKIDFQGPLSPKIIKRLLDKPIDELKYYHWMHNSYHGQKAIVSRTGYTGEIGFEIYLDENHTKKFWDDCLSLGASPAGLGARDTLRLEMGYPLYGHELCDSRNAAESGFTRAIAMDKEFIGSQVVLDPNCLHDVLCGIKIEGRRSTRNGDSISDMKGDLVGTVTSGSFSPSLGCAVAIGYVKKELGAVGTKLVISAGKTMLTGTVTEMPFYKQGTARGKLADFLS